MNKNQPFPTEVPVLETSDCKGSNTLGHWFDQVFGNCKTAIQGEVTYRIYCRIQSVSNSYLGVLTFRGRPSNVSVIWNQAMSDLGYTEKFWKN